MADSKNKKSSIPVAPPVSVDPFQRWLLISEAAAYLRVCQQTIRALIHNGELKAARIGKSYRIDRADLDVMAERRKKIQPRYRTNSHPWVAKRWAEFRRKQAKR